jgi:hypothetical protein
MSIEKMRSCILLAHEVGWNTAESASPERSDDPVLRFGGCDSQPLPCFFGLH